MLRVEFRLIHGRRHGRLDEGGREKVIECRARSDLRPQPGPSEFRRGGAGSPQSYRCRCWLGWPAWPTGGSSAWWRGVN